jgi:hypothetical protein
VTANEPRAERLVGYLDRRGRTDELLEKLDQLRPKVAWPIGVIND